MILWRCPCGYTGQPYEWCPHCNRSYLAAYNLGEQPDPLDLVCCPPGTCEHAACEARYLRRIQYPSSRPLRSWPKDPDEDRWPE